MNIPGMAASHQVITQTCRDNRGMGGAFDEAVDRLRVAYCELAAKGFATETEIHLALIVQQERHRATAPPVTGETVTLTKYRRHTDGFVFFSTDILKVGAYDVLARRSVEIGGEDSNDTVPRSRYDACNRDWREEKAKREEIASNAAREISKRDAAIKAAIEAYRDRDLSPGESAAKMSDILESAISGKDS